MGEMVAPWCIHYGDGSTFTSSDGTPADAPPWNIQVIAQANKTVGRELLHKCDYFIRVDDVWVGVDLTGLIDHLAHRGDVKVGRALPTEQFREIHQAAIESYNGLPKKNGWL